MDILRNIEKKILNIANNNTNDVNSLKKDIKEYLDNFDKQQDINNQKKNKYEELYENKRMLAHISYENYLSIKEDLMKEIKKELDIKTMIPAIIFALKENLFAFIWGISIVI